MINRPTYLNDLIKWKDENFMKIITGVRRCGKSTLFKLYKEYLLENSVLETQIMIFNLEDPKYDFSTYRDLYDHINSLLKDNIKYYIFIDEVQNVQEFEKAINGLYIKPNVDLYITGSNAFLLSNELSTLLTGRYIEIKMHPLSFKEYYEASRNKNKQELFLQFMKYGGFPEVVNLIEKDIQMVNQYLETLYTTVVYKDIITKNNITDPLLLESVLKYIIENIGSTISTKKIVDTLISLNRKTTNPTIENYIKSYIDSFLIIKIDRFDVFKKNTLSTGYKYYTVDTGLNNYLSKKKLDVDMGHTLENIVLLELLRRGYKVYVGKSKNYEIDFVAKKIDEINYFQVSYSILNEEIANREIRSLKNVKDNYPKYILTLDQVNEFEDDGIKIINVIDWLLDV